MAGKATESAIRAVGNAIAKAVEAAVPRAEILRSVAGLEPVAALLWAHLYQFGGSGPQQAAALVGAGRHDPNLRAFRQRLIGRGKPHQVTATAAIPKLEVLAKTLLGDDRLGLPDMPAARVPEASRSLKNNRLRHRVRPRID